MTASIAAVDVVKDAMHDVIVVGAGVAGASLAISLARDGRKVLCIERYLYDGDTTQLSQPNRIVGELLQPGGYEKLVQLGLQEAVEGIDAQHIYGYAVFLNGRAEEVDYTAHDELESKQKQHLQKRRPAGRSFHNGRFLRRLREIATSHPNITLIEGHVTSLDMKDSNVVGVCYKSPRLTKSTIHHVRAHLTVACDGCSSNLRRRASVAETVSVYSTFHGLLLDMTDIPFPNHGHVVLADPTPVLFYPVSSTHVRCLVDISSDFQGNVTNYMLKIVLPQIPEQFQTPFEKAILSGQIRMMPNRVMPAVADMIPGAILLGDAFNMRHPLTGGGMTVALSDIMLIRNMLRSIKDLSNVKQVTLKLKDFYVQRKPLSSTINILANALYTLFCAHDPALKDMRDACFDYFTSGGRFTHDPMGMLGGLKPHRFLLIIHFFAVSIYGCGRALKPYPTPARLTHAWNIFKASFNVIKPLIDAERLAPLHWIPVTSL